MRSVGLGVLVVLLIAAGALAFWQFRAPGREVAPGQPAGTVADRSAPSVAELTSESASSRLERGVPADTQPWLRRLPPRTRIPVRLPPQASGIRCPDGTFLPLLNGVPHAPPISRSSKAAPLTPVVELAVDDTGCQWFVHADGSTTTSRWVEYTDALGTKGKQVVTDHNEVVPPEYALDGEGRQLAPRGGR